MSCSPFDLKDYFLRELPNPQALQVEEHVKGCLSCREELDRLRLTEAALFALRDEEVPQRIAFVSDPVFEPSRARRWFTAFWQSGPRLGFASAGLLSSAILFSALTRPAPITVSNLPAAKPVVASAAPGITPEEVERQIQAAVAKAVAESHEETVALVANMERASQADRQKLISIYEAELVMQRKRDDVQRLAAYYAPEEGRGGAQ